jgi:phospholipase D-like protein
MVRGFPLRVLVLVVLISGALRTEAQERLCDPAFEDCRTPLWNLIDAETVGIDVAFWFMQDSSYATKLINKFKAGVPVRVIVDPRANPTYDGNEAVLNQLKTAGIPMRYKPGGGIVHWKMMLFAGQNKLEFSGANYSGNFFVPDAPNSNYFDEAIYFTNDLSLIQSFKTKYDDVWTNTVDYANFANINGPLTRKYPTFPINPELNFPPSPDASQDFFLRTQQNINAETKKIDVIMYRITNQGYTDATIAAVKRGVPVRLIHEPEEYRNPERQWDSWNVDRLFMAGVQIKMRKHLGLNHQKSVLLYGGGMTIFGSSNWTGPSSNSQLEHNYFTTRSTFFQWFVTQFERKWTSTTENQPFVPLPPTQPTNLFPLNGATAQLTTMTLQWEGGPWAHKYDIYFGTSPSPPLLVANASTFQSGAQAGQPLLETGSPDDGVKETYKIPTTLQTGTTYFWRVVSKTMANQTADGPTWSFTTQGSPTPVPTPAPVLLNDGSTNRGLALHSPLFTREPFAVATLLNMSADQRTRVMLFASNVDPATRSTWVVTAVSSTGAQYQLPVEYAGACPGVDSVTSFIVMLPQDPALHGDLTVTLSVAGVRSNPIVFGIR